MIRKCEEQELDDGILITLDTQMTLYCWLRIKFKVQLIFNRVNEESERTSVAINIGKQCMVLSKYAPGPRTQLRPEG